MHACARARSGRTGALRRSLSSVRRKRAHEAAASCARSPERPGPWAAAAPRACGWCASARSAALRSFCAAWTPCAWRCARHSLHVRLRLCGLSSRRLAPADVARCGMARLERVDMDMGRCGVMHGRHGACTRVALAIAPRRTTRGGVRRAACAAKTVHVRYTLCCQSLCVKLSTRSQTALVLSQGRVLAPLQARNSTCGCGQTSNNNLLHESCKVHSKVSIFATSRV